MAADKPKATPTKATSPALVGSLWEIVTSENVAVRRPDGATVTVKSDGKVARHVLDVAGTYTADVPGNPETIEAS